MRINRNCPNPLRDALSAGKDRRDPTKPVMCPVKSSAGDGHMYESFCPRIARVVWWALEHHAVLERTDPAHVGADALAWASVVMREYRAAASAWRNVLAKLQKPGGENG